MGDIWLRNLPEVLAGLPRLEFYTGWENRSRRGGGYDALLGIAVHHTASKTTTERDCAYIWLNAKDRPIGAIYLGRAGEIVVGAAGATNCQGVGGPRTCSRGTIPKDRGNANAIAVEAGNNGVGEPWPVAQQDAYVALVERLVNGYGFAVPDVFAHREWTSRKIDPAGPSRFGSVNASGSWNMDLFRDELEPEPVPPTPTPPDDEEDEMLFDGLWKRDNHDAVYAIYKNGTKQWLTDPGYQRAFTDLQVLNGAKPPLTDVRTQSDPSMFAAFGIVIGPRPGGTDEWGNPV